MQADPDTPKAPPGPPDLTEVRYLTPDTCTIHLGTLSSLHVTVRDEGIYGGVYAAYAFPVSYRENFISLMHTGGDGEETEIGLVRDVNAFPESQANLIREALARRYLIHTILQIHKIGWDHGLVRFDTETDKGRICFLMRWKHDRAVDYGQRGKVLIDVYDNHYLIPDLEKLPAKEQQDFRRIIYW